MTKASHFISNKTQFWIKKRAPRERALLPKYGKVAHDAPEGAIKA